MRRPAAPKAAIGPPLLPPLSVIVMNRAAYGPRAGDLAAFELLGVDDDARLGAWLNQQLSPATLVDTECDQRLAAQSYVTLNKSLTHLWADYILPAQANRSLPIEETCGATLLRMIYSRPQLFEALVEFRQMLGQVAAHPAMLYYLDNAYSSSAGPNENWGREWFERHTLGAENYMGVQPQSNVPGYAAGTPEKYVDANVYEATRAFTGWRVNDNTWEQGVQNTGAFLYYDSWHDRFQKTILGLPVIPANQAPMADATSSLTSSRRIRERGASSAESSAAGSSPTRRPTRW